MTSTSIHPTVIVLPEGLGAMVLSETADRAGDHGNYWHVTLGHGPGRAHQVYGLCPCEKGRRVGEQRGTGERESCRHWRLFNTHVARDSAARERLRRGVVEAHVSALTD